MFCKSCGKEISNESEFCPYCMTKFTQEKVAPEINKDKKIFSKQIIIIVSIVLVVAVIATIVLLATNGKLKKNNEAVNGGISSNYITEVTFDGNLNHKDVEKDDSFGLSFMKTYNDGANLTDTQKLMIQYFDHDYFYFEGDCQALQRYPKAYKNSQVKMGVIIEKVISSDDTNYIFLARLGYNYWPDKGKNDNTKYIAMVGTYGETRPILDDNLLLYGKYTGVNTYTVDGKSYTIPTIKTIRYQYVYDCESASSLFTKNEIKSLATTIFGNNIKMSLAYSHNELVEINMDHGYVVELDNQSDANFTKYLFDDTFGCCITDLKDVGGIVGTGVERKMTFTADFSHFILSIFDTNMNTYTMEYYDKDLKKIWSREFDETTSVAMDYTPSHIYIVANCKMYILDTTDGKDAIDPKYVGEKRNIRKLTDGILLIADSGSDPIVKTDLNGNVLWTVNTNNQFSGVESSVVQFIDGNYVMVYESNDGELVNGYPATRSNIVVITPKGEKLMDMVSQIN